MEEQEMRLRSTTLALLSLLGVSAVYAQVPATTTQPQYAVEKTLQTFTLGTLTSVNCTDNINWLGCPGGPFLDGVIPLVAPTQNANTLLMGPTSGAAALPDFRVMSGVQDRIANGIPTRYTGTNCQQAAVGTDITNTSTETTFYSCQVLGGRMGTDSVIVLHIFGFYKYD